MQRAMRRFSSFSSSSIFLSFFLSRLPSIPKWTVLESSLVIVLSSYLHMNWVGGCSEKPNNNGDIITSLRNDFPMGSLSDWNRGNVPDNPYKGTVYGPWALYYCISLELTCRIRTVDDFDGLNTFYAMSETAVELDVKPQVRQTPWKFEFYGGHKDSNYICLDKPTFRAAQQCKLPWT